MPDLQKSPLSRMNAQLKSLGLKYDWTTFEDASAYLGQHYPDRVGKLMLHAIGFHTRVERA